MSGADDNPGWMREMLHNLEACALAVLPPEKRDQRFSEELLAEAIRQARQGGGSLVLSLGLVFALTSPDADYHLVIKQNTKRNPGGVQSHFDLKNRLQRAEEVRAFVDDELGLDKRESAIAAACQKFDLGRARVFELLAEGRFFHTFREEGQGGSA